LDEGKKVKERFDDIFDATKQNKYLEHIRMKKKAVTDRKLACRILGYYDDGYEEFCLVFWPRLTDVLEESVTSIFRTGA
jgi:hypothetical protein